MNPEEQNVDADASAMMPAPPPTTGGMPPYAPSLGGEPDAILTPKGEFAPDWYSHFEELKKHAPTLSKFRRPEALAKSYAALERMKGYPGVENAQQMSSFRRTVGLPESAAEYKIPRPENTPDELWDEGFVGSIAELAYEYGVPAPAMEALTAQYCKENSRMMQQVHRRQQEAVLAADTELQETWGPQYDDHMSAIGSVLESVGERAGVDVRTLADNPALRANTDFAKLMLEVANMVGEPTMRTGNPVNGKEEAYRIAHDPTHPLHEAYMRTSHPQHRYANEQYDRFAFGSRI